MRCNTPLFFLICIALLAILGSGCVAPKVMTMQTFVADRSVKHAAMVSQQDNLDDSGMVLYNYFIRICDLNAQGKEIDCNETLVLENVYPQSIYGVRR